MRKNLTQSGDWSVRATLDSVSKNALADLVIDLIRLQHGKEDLDGEALIQAFLKAMGPIARVRKDRAPEAVRPMAPQGTAQEDK